MKGRKKQIAGGLTPPQIITLSFLFMILTGAFLLNLPIASQSGKSIGFINALFTATSANCVTGLVVVNTKLTFTLFGKGVILLLIQLGGIGLISVLMIFMVYLGQKISLKDRMIIQASFNQDNVGGMVRLVKFIVLFTLLAEMAGALLLTLGFYYTGSMNITDALANGIFHSISAFCNAGFDNIGTSGMMPYRGNYLISLLLAAMIIAGGLGFPVWRELLGRRKEEKSLRYRIRHLSLHSKIAIRLTIYLVLFGTFLFLVLEWNNQATLGGLPFFEKLLAALFQSVTLRTCGFNTIDQAGLLEPSQFISCLLMLVGGSPASTAGGLKTVTFGILVISMLSAFRGRDKVEAFGRKIPLGILQKALTVAFTILAAAVASTMALYFTERYNEFPHSFLDLLFECSSAVATVGLTTGLTPHLSDAGKLILTLCMFLGRLSPLTIAVALNIRMHGRNKTSYPEEKVMIG